MTTTQYILAIDQGTTSTRAIVFDNTTRSVAVAQQEFAQHYPQPGWVEHEPADIWRDTLACAREAIAKAGLTASQIAAIGVTNQRETVVVWDRASGEPIHRALVWQDRRTADVCARLREVGLEDVVRARTGLLLDPYFSGTKLGWLLDHVPGARARAERGELAAGTIDTFLLWHLTGGAVHATDVTNAGRTLLWDIHAQAWDEELCRALGVPLNILPTVGDTSQVYGPTPAGLFGAPIPVASLVGDQQAALFGQVCFAPGEAKSTYGTGCFMLLNCGDAGPVSTNRLLTTPAWRLGGKMTYALEGSIFVAGAAVKWLRDGLGLIGGAAETAALAASVPDSDGVVLVPGFTGLGAPWWDPAARGSLTGLTLGTTRAHLARATLEAVAYQTRDLTDAMHRDGAPPPAALRVDGGMAANDWLCQFLADVLDTPVERPANVETTALGAAFHAGLAVGVWPDLAALKQTWTRDARFEPQLGRAARTALLDQWHAAVRRTLSKPA